MRFSIFFQLRFPEPWTADGEYKCLQEAMEQIIYAEEMGFDAVWMTEHPFSPNWSTASAPDVMLSAVSQRTSKMRLGFGMVLSPIHHPLHVAVKVSTLDLLSNGRVDLGIGRPPNPYFTVPFGVSMDDSAGMTREALSMIPRMWTEDVFSFEGEYYNVPPREIAPKPLQKPHPPIWTAAGQEDTARMAGNLGLGCMLHVRFGLERVQRFVKTYKEAIRDAKPVGSFVNDHAIGETIALCEENNQRARQRGAESVVIQNKKGQLRRRLHWSRGREDSPSEKSVDQLQHVQNDPPYQAPDDLDSLLDDACWCFGDPDACIEFAEQYEAAGLEELMLDFQAVFGTTHQDSMNSIRLFGKYVIPHFQEKAKKAKATA